MEISRRLTQPVDAASLAVFRVAFGGLLVVLPLRYFIHGWIDEYFLEPSHFFKYWGFGWVQPLPAAGMYAVFGLMVLCALGVMLGYRYRVSTVVYGLLFGYQHLIDKTNYLNHYYLVACVCALMACLPLASTWSLDARRGEPSSDSVPAYALWALRAQFGLVYVFGGLAKLNEDWLLRAEPLTVWLERKSELWGLLGGVASQPWFAFAMSWAGALFDLSIVPLLLLRRTRPFAYGAVLLFHLLTAQLFSIGMFPYLMVAGSLVFAEPSWPRALLGRLGVGFESVGRVLAPPSRLVLPLLGLYFVVQLALPLRHWLYPGDMRWTEQGFRFSWSVMVMEKNGSVDFRVREPKTGRIFHAAPSDYFTPYQVAMMSPQPDMVQEAARVVAEDFRARGVEDPEVFVDAFAALNGRAMQRLVDPDVDLSRAPEGLADKPWILPLTPRPQAHVAVARSME